MREGKKIFEKEQNVQALCKVLVVQMPVRPCNVPERVE